MEMKHFCFVLRSPGQGMTPALGKCRKEGRCCRPSFPAYAVADARFVLFTTFRRGEIFVWFGDSIGRASAIFIAHHLSRDKEGLLNMQNNSPKRERENDPRDRGVMTGQTGNAPPAEQPKAVELIGVVTDCTRLRWDGRS